MNEKTNTTEVIDATEAHEVIAPIADEAAQEVETPKAVEPVEEQPAPEPAQAESTETAAAQVGQGSPALAPLGYRPHVYKDCEGATWAHPATTTAIGAPDTYAISVNGGTRQPYTPNEVIALEWPEDGSAPIVSLFGTYANGFTHQLGQSRIMNTDECEVEVQPVECPEGKVPGWLDENGNPQGCVDNNPNPGQPKPEPNNPQVVPEHPVIDVPGKLDQVTVQPVAVDGTLAVTGAGDMAGVGLAAVVLVAAGVTLMKRAVRRA